MARDLNSQWKGPAQTPKRTRQPTTNAAQTHASHALKHIGAIVRDTQIAAMLDATADMVIIADPQWRPFYLNRAARKQLGAEENVDLTNVDIAAHMTADALRQLHQQALPTAMAHGAWSGQATWLTPDGREMTVSQVIIAHRSANGELECFSILARDISDRKSIEYERQQLLAERDQRVCELTMLHETSQLLQQHQGSVEELIIHLTQRLPKVWRCSNQAEVRIRYGEICRQTPGFRKSSALHIATFTTNDGTRGSIEVAYCQWVDHQQAAPSANQQQQLLDSLVEMLRNHLDRRWAEAQLRAAAYHDALTQTPNRAMFLDRLDQAIQRCRQDRNSSFAVLFLDLDRFKVINDSLGHSVGDQLLICLTKRLCQYLRPNDLLARMSGDEFTVLLDGDCGAERAESIAEQLLQAVAKPFIIANREIVITASIGLAVWQGSDEATTAESFLRDADTAMYFAKGKGKACYQLFDRQMHQGAVDRLELESDLRRAIQAGQLRLQYQPIVALDEQRIIGFEALVRWQHPIRGLINPAAFIPIAEETGLIVPIGRWVLQHACRQMASWQRRFGYDDLSIAVNLASQHLHQSDLIATVDQALMSTDLDPHCLKLEITESAVIEPSMTTRNALTALRQRRIALCMDDFGTGYSSLSYLHQLPFDVLKIDRSFIHRIKPGQRDTQLVQGIINLADSLGLTVVAEGVETDAQLTLLREMNCAMAQGYLFSKPLDPQNAEQLLLADQHATANILPA